MSEENDSEWTDDFAESYGQLLYYLQKSLDEENDTDNLMVLWAELEEMQGDILRRLKTFTENKPKYTLKQLRQAYGAGVHSAQSPKEPCK